MRYSWWGYVKSMIKRYRLGKVTRRERAAVLAAIAQTYRLPYAADRLKLIDAVFWRQTHTLAGAAMKIHVSERTAQEWHRQFIRMVATNFGLM